MRTEGENKQICIFLLLDLFIIVIQDFSQLDRYLVYFIISPMVYGA